MASHWNSVGEPLNWKPRVQPAVKWILVLNIGVFCLQVILSTFFKSQAVVECLQFIPSEFLRGRVWTMGTYMFMHTDFLHLAFNLLLFYGFGNEVEREVGSKHLLSIFLTGGILGAIFWLGFNVHSAIPVIGASGAIYSVAIAFATLFPNRVLTMLIYFVLPISMRAKYWAYLIVLLSIIFSVIGGDGVAHLAHLGGVVMGYVYIRWIFKSSLGSVFSFKSKRVNNGNLRVVPPSSSGRKYIQQEIDPILEKIAQSGIHSLTPKERKILDEAKDRMP